MGQVLVPDGNHCLFPVHQEDVVGLNEEIARVHLGVHDAVPLVPEKPPGAFGQTEDFFVVVQQPGPLALQGMSGEELQQPEAFRGDVADRITLPDQGVVGGKRVDSSEQTGRAPAVGAVVERPAGQVLHQQHSTADSVAARVRLAEEGSRSHPGGLHCLQDSKFVGNLILQAQLAPVVDPEDVPALRAANGEVFVVFPRGQILDGKRSSDPTGALEELAHVFGVGKSRLADLSICFMRHRIPPSKRRFEGEPMSWSECDAATGPSRS